MHTFFPVASQFIGYLQRIMIVIPLNQAPMYVSTHNMRPNFQNKTN